jgi:adenylate cyclase
VSEKRKLAAILAADVVGFSRLTGADEDRTLARLRALRSDLIDPAIAVHNGRVVKRTGDGAIVEFRSVVDAVRCAVEVQNAMIDRNAGVPEDSRIVFRIGIHLGDVVEESDGDLMGDGVNIAARLEGIAAPGAICLSEQAYWQVKGRLNVAVTDLGPTQLKNIAEPVRVYSVEVGKPAQAKPAPETRPPNPKTRAARAPLAAGIAALLIMIALGAWYFLFANRSTIVAAIAPAPTASSPVAPAEAKHLSIVVLPFANLSGDPAQDYFADGVTENLTSELSRIRDSFVIARNTAFTFKGKSLDAKEIGNELGVRYVLEGSVQREGARVRVNAQLIDAESGAHLWADRFEEDVADLFKLQDQVVSRLAGSLGYALTYAEAEKGARSINPDAIDLTTRGWSLIWRGQSQAPNERNERDNEVRALFDQALKIDPNDPDALAGSSYIYFSDFFFGRSDAPTDYEAKVLGLANRAIALDPGNVRAYFAKASYLNSTHRPSEGLGVADAGLAINPNFALLYVPRAVAEISLGRFEQAKADIERAMRLSPRDPYIGLFHVMTGRAEFGLGHLDAAIDEIHQAIDSNYRTYFVYTYLAAACAQAGKMDEAKTALAEARRLNPKLTVKWMIEHTSSTPATLDGVCKAGLPEDVSAEAKHLSIVVLPFANLSGDSSQDYFADGITENLTTELSRIRDSFVIARNSAFTFKGKAIDAKAIGKELGVRYVLEGSVQRDQNRVRVNAQLVDAESGAHIWADRFEEDVADLFKLQDQVVARLTNSLGNELIKAEADKSVRSKNPDAIDLDMRGRALLLTEFRPGANRKEIVHAAQALFERALTIDPNESDALADAAYTYHVDYFNEWITPAIDYDAKVLGLVDRAIALAPDNVWAYCVKSFYLNASRRQNEGLHAIDEGLAINPNYPMLYHARAYAEISLGRYD